MIRVHKGIALIPSSRRKSIKYHVHYSPMLGRWLCDCPDFRHRRMESGGECKHIDYYHNWLESASQEELENASKEEA